MRRADRYRDGLWLPGLALPEEALRRVRSAVLLLDQLRGVPRCPHVTGSIPVAGAFLCVGHPRGGLKCRPCLEAHRVRPRSGHGRHGSCPACGAEPGPDPDVPVPALRLPSPEGEYHYGVRLVGFDLCPACLTGGVGSAQHEAGVIAGPPR